MSTGRNEPCPCGSGKKYKQCCLGKADPEMSRRNQRAAIVGLLFLIAAVVSGIAASREIGFGVAMLGVVILGLWYWFSEPPPKAGSGSDPSAINFGR